MKIDNGIVLMNKKIMNQLEFAVKNNYNVLLIGEAGVGKTAVIKQVFESMNFSYMYFSAATMDPWVDFVGVPKEVEDTDGNKYLDLIRPKQFAFDTIDAIFMDEYNRCLAGDTKILLADGTSEKIKDLVGRSHFYVFAYDSERNSVEIAKAHSARLTNPKNEKLLKITLDNGAFFICTKDHPILRSSNEYDQAINFLVGDSLMPFYRFWKQNGYETVLQPYKKRWELTYHMADVYNLRNNVYKLSDGDHRHHIDFTKTNNSPENIIRLTEQAHMKLHAGDKIRASSGGVAVHKIHPDLYEKTIGAESSRAKALSNSVKTRQTSTSYKKKRSKISKDMYTSEYRDYRKEITKQQWASGQFNNIDRKLALQLSHNTRVLNKLKEYMIEIETLTEVQYDELSLKLKNKNISSLLKKTTIERNYKTFENFKQILLDLHRINKNNNHKIIKIEEVESEDTYDITVDEFHNFAIECGIFVHNSPAKVRNASMELIQFKSINGKKYNRLKMVWAAINPYVEEDNKYNVEELDPAQLDRFDFHIEIPYKINIEYFSLKYPEISKPSVEWWDALPIEQKKIVSPRRLDKALQTFTEGGDLSWVIPKGVNISQLATNLKYGSYQDRLKQVYKSKDEDEIKKLINDKNTLSDFVKHILKNKTYCDFFLPYVSDERLSSLLDHDQVINYLMHPIVAAERKQLITSIINTKSVKVAVLDQFKSIIKSLNPPSTESTSAGLINENVKFQTKVSSNRTTAYQNGTNADFNLLFNSWIVNDNSYYRKQLLNLLKSQIKMADIDCKNITFAVKCFRVILRQFEIGIYGDIELVKLYNSLTKNFTDNGISILDIKSEIEKIYPIKYVKRLNNQILENTDKLYRVLQF